MENLQKEDDKLKPDLACQDDILQQRADGVIQDMHGILEECQRQYFDEFAQSIQDGTRQLPRITVHMRNDARAYMKNYFDALLGDRAAEDHLRRYTPVDDASRQRHRVKSASVNDIDTISKRGKNKRPKETSFVDSSSDESVVLQRDKSPVAKALSRHSKLDAVYRLIQTPTHPISEWAKRLRKALRQRGLSEDDDKLRALLMPLLTVKLPGRMGSGMPEDSLREALKYLETYDRPAPTLRSLWNKKGILTDKPSVAFAHWKEDFAQVMEDSSDRDKGRWAWQMMLEEMP